MLMSLNHSPPYFFFLRHSLSLGLEFTHQLASSSEPWGPSCLSPVLELQSVHQHACLFAMGSGNQTQILIQTLVQLSHFLCPETDSSKTLMQKPWSIHSLGWASR